MKGVFVLIVGILADSSRVVAVAQESCGVLNVAFKVVIEHYLILMRHRKKLQPVPSAGMTVHFLKLVVVVIT